MAIRVGINGFGRIGKCVLRVLLGTDDLEPVLINDLASPRQLAPLLKYDSVHGKVPYEVSGTDDSITAGDRTIRCTSLRNPEEVPWGEMGCDVVLECTGIFRDREGAGRILAGGAPKVIISAPAKNPDATIVMGVNHDTYNPAEHRIISNASCTTNCLAPVAKVLHEQFGGIESGLMTTIHAYTNDQNILDRFHSDPRRARAAAQNMVPTTTGAAKAVSLVLPELEGKLSGMAVRVPTANVSLVDLVVQLGTDGVTRDEVNGALEAAANGPLGGVLSVCNEPLVSCDYIGNPASSTVDALSTDVLGGNLVKVLSWYDNEWGFSNRMADLSRLVAG
ncbi:MAG TPA: type I glyceraldehyde-3-phosphate dehydrogenase [Deltaproteobacteria bacterium]|nr:type I glyceraldehyde-3-phosphate dehydrogenase [Deltaproteobacteria bacterium]HCP45137.1 type I glyceraldehyde-3-phosphate dehydrogenase [Deltaproteobacteria bacterium]